MGGENGVKGISLMLCAALLHSAAGPVFAQGMSVQTPVSGSAAPSVVLPAALSAANLVGANASPLPDSGIRALPFTARDAVSTAVPIDEAEPVKAAAPVLAGRIAHDHSAAAVIQTGSAVIRNEASVIQPDDGVIPTGGVAVTDIAAGQTAGQKAQTGFRAPLKILLSMRRLGDSFGKMFDGAKGSRQTDGLRETDARPSQLDAAADIGGSALQQLSFSHRFNVAAAAEQDIPPPSVEEKPKSSLFRSFNFGYAMGWLMVAEHLLALGIAKAAGYVFHGDYAAEAVSGGMPAPLALGIGIAGAVLAPIAEEVIYRGAFMEMLRKTGPVGAASKPDRFWVPALISSVVFVLMHETSDPLLIAVRLVGSLILSRAYYKEGLLSSIAAHSTFNIIAQGLPLFAAVFGEIAEPILMFAGACILVCSMMILWKERGDRGSGRIIAQGLTPLLARRLAGILIVGGILASFLAPAMLGGLSYWLAAVWMLCGGNVRWKRLFFGKIGTKQSERLH
ncbi:MAG: CPBP family intramembrane glutamic endopeptidase [Elusimicrobiota bacterium]